MSQKEYRFVGMHADNLEDGTQLAPGDYTGPITAKKGGHNATLVEENLLIEVPDGTYDEVMNIDKAATSTSEDGDNS
jgi:hypothetical protein